MSDKLNKPSTDATPGQWVCKEELDKALAEVEEGERSRVYLRSLIEEAQEQIRRLDAQLQGQGTGLHALDMLLGYPKDGLIEAVKRLVRERESWQEDRAEVARLRGLLRETLELADEAISYTPEYFQTKWTLPETAKRLRREGGLNDE